ncbi:MAG: hypothetical protein LBJ35_00540 [Spirochaetaceae bacterium]|jgi:hypothetical protein|nr:hypothetical protein [Spirochaetaceae bacterium]
MRIKTGVFGLILLLSAGFLQAEVRFFCGAGGGLLISSSQTDGGIIEGRMSVGNVYYAVEREGLASYSGMFSLHGGVIGLGGLISIETGVDFCIGNKNEIVINFLDYPVPNARFQTYYSYSSLDIPILVAMPLPITDKLVIRPAAGFYVSIPLGDAEYHQEAEVFSDPTLTESYRITSKALAGFEGDIKLLYLFERINGRIFLDCAFKYDLNPLHGVNNSNTHWSLERQTLSVAVGYEHIF